MRTRSLAPIAALLLTLIAGPATAQTPAPAEPKKPEPFTFADFSWLTGNPRTKESPIDNAVFTGEFRAGRQLHLQLQQARRRHARLYAGSSQGGESSDPRAAGEVLMLDALFIVATIAFFGVALLYVRGCERLR